MVAHGDESNSKAYAEEEIKSQNKDIDNTKNPEAEPEKSVDTGVGTIKC